MCKCPVRNTSGLSRGCAWAYSWSSFLAVVDGCCTWQVNILQAPSTILVEINIVSAKKVQSARRHHGFPNPRRHGASFGCGRSQEEGKGIRGYVVTTIDQCLFSLSQVVCYLCGQKVKKLFWDNKSHRQNCAMQKDPTLQAMEEYQGEGCPNCYLKLRIWPKDMGEEWVFVSFLHLAQTDFITGWVSS